MKNKNNNKIIKVHMNKDLLESFNTACESLRKDLLMHKCDRSEYCSSLYGQVMSVQEFVNSFFKYAEGWGAARPSNAMSYVLAYGQEQVSRIAKEFQQHRKGEQK